MQVSLLDDMRMRRIPPTTMIWGAVVGAAAKAGRVEEAVAMLQEMVDVDGCFPDAGVYSAAINACASTAKYSQALVGERTFLNLVSLPPFHRPIFTTPYSAKGPPSRTLPPLPSPARRAPRRSSTTCVPRPASIPTVRA